MLSILRLLIEYIGGDEHLNLWIKASQRSLKRPLTW